MNATFSTSAAAEEMSLGWTSMPAFRGRMNQDTDAAQAAEFISQTQAERAPKGGLFTGFWSVAVGRAA